MTCGPARSAVGALLVGLLVSAPWAWAQEQPPPTGVAISAASDPSDALLRLGDYYSDDAAGQVDYVRALDYYQQAAAAGRAGGTLRIAQMLIAGQGTEADLASGLAMLETLAAEDYPAALVALGELYIAGIPDALEAAPEKGLALLERAADGGDANAMMLWGDALVRLQGASVDPSAILATYQRAADLGRVDALLRIGEFWTEGAMVPVDLSKGYAAYEKAAGAGSTSARLRMAEMLARGHGVPANAERGLQIVRAEAEAGNGTALLLLAELLMSGDVGAIDIAGAITALEQAAETGRPEALLRLGAIYRDGIAGPPNGARAYGYLAEAVAAGHDFARYLLARGLTEGRFNRPGAQAEGLAMLGEALAAGTEEAAIGIANAHLYGYGLPQDPATAIALLESEAATGNLAAARRLLSLFRDGSRDGDVVLVTPDAARAKTYLAMIAPTLGRGDLLVETLLMEAAATRDGNYAALAGRIGELSPDHQESLLRNLVSVAPNAFVYLVQGQLRTTGLYAGPQHGLLDQPTISAMLRYCDSKQVGEVCRRGPLTSQSAQILSYVF
jgi:TPR repeat protein